MGNKLVVYSYPSDTSPGTFNYTFDVRGLTERQIRSLVLAPLEACKLVGYEIQVESQTVKVWSMDQRTFQQMFSTRGWRVKVMTNDTPLARVYRKWCEDHPTTAVIG